MTRVSNIFSVYNFTVQSNPNRTWTSESHALSIQTWGETNSGINKSAQEDSNSSTNKNKHEKSYRPETAHTKKHLSWKRIISIFTLYNAANKHVT